MRSTFTNEQIASMASWLNNEEKNHICNSNVTTLIDIEQLNDKQRSVHEIVAHHANSSEKEPLHLLVTGQDGSGKSYVINSLRQLLGSAVWLHLILVLRHITSMELHFILC